MPVFFNKTKYYPNITPIDQKVKRPFWSIMIPTYNRSTYLAQTLARVLEQDLGPDYMQIEVVDDCSTQGDFETIVQEIGKGRVGFYRQPRNLGIGGNWNACIRRARGYWIHLLHEDDLVKGDFYKVYESIIRKYPKSTLITSPVDFINGEGDKIGYWDAIQEDEGIVAKFLELQAIENRIPTPAAVLPRWLYEKIGGYDESLRYTLDWDLFFRAGLMGQVITLTTSHSSYRVHSTSATSRILLTGRNVWESIIVINKCFKMLPKDSKKRLASVKYHHAAANARKYSDIFAKEQLWLPSVIQAMFAVYVQPNRYNAYYLKKAIMSGFRNRIHLKS